MYWQAQGSCGSMDRVVVSVSFNFVKHFASFYIPLLKLIQLHLFTDKIMFQYCGQVFNMVSGKKLKYKMNFRNICGC